MADLSSLTADQLADRIHPHDTKSLHAVAELCRRLKTAEDALEQMECRCYDVPTLAPTDNPIEHVCDRCRALAALRSPDPKP